MSSAPFAPIHSQTEASHRIPVPEAFVSRFGWLKGKQPIPVWLWLLSDGHYRVLTEEQAQSDSVIAPIRALIVDGPSEEPTPASEAQDDEEAAMPAKLIQTNVTPPPPVWRIVIPKAARAFPPLETKRFSTVLTIDGHWEIWHTDILWRVASRSRE